MPRQDFYPPIKNPTNIGGSYLDPLLDARQLLKGLFVQLLQQLPDGLVQFIEAKEGLGAPGLLNLELRSPRSSGRSRECLGLSPDEPSCHRRWRRETYSRESVLRRATGEVAEARALLPLRAA